MTIAQKAGENDQLFGSVTASDIATALEKQGYTIDRRKIQLEEPIKTLGDYKVTVRLHREVTVEIPVHVVKEKNSGRRKRLPHCMKDLILDPARFDEVPAYKLLEAGGGRIHRD